MAALTAERLREVVSYSENIANIGVRKTNRSGFKGVVPNRKRWSAQIKARGVQYHLGTFDTPHEAHLAYCNAAEKHYGQFARAS